MVAEECGEAVPPLPAIVIKPMPEERPGDELDDSDFPQLLDWPWDPALQGLQLLPLDSSWLHALHKQSAGRENYVTNRVNLFAPAQTSAAARRSAMSVLAHELAHYLQDLRHEPTAPEPRRTIDATAALHALFEGEAILVGWRVFARITGKTAEELEWDESFDWQSEQILSELAASRAPLTAALTEMPYPIGGRFIAKLWLTRGRGAVDALFQDSPDTIANWLNASTDGTPRASVIEPVGCAGPPAGTAYRFKARTTLGVLGALALLAAADATDLELSSKLRGDSLALYDWIRPQIVPFGPLETEVLKPRVLVAWQMLFTDDSAAHSFAQAIQPLGFALERTGWQLLVKAAGDPERDATELIAPIPCN